MKIRVDSIRASVLAIPFKVAFKHASAERSAMQSLWVEARSGAHEGYGEGCPREYVTHETLEGAQRFVEQGAAGWSRAIDGVQALAAHVDAHRREIDANPAAWSAVEIALIDLYGKATGRTVEELLGLAPLSGKFRYSAVIGDASPAAFEGQLAHYLAAGFRAFKIKLSGDLARDRAKVEALARAGVEPARVRADANNLFAGADAAVAHLAALEFPFAAIEEPLAAGDYDGMRRIAKATAAGIILDESLLRVEQLEALRSDPQTWIANIRISKMGGLLRALALAREARRLGLRIVVGAHVGETSVLTRAGLTVAQAAGEALLAQEGAFGTHLLQHDVVEPLLMFGGGGILEAGPALAGPGLGLRRQGVALPS
jgi:L-alanine-DL-glutamate epimerase-like enolase superfamily enzyme